MGFFSQRKQSKKNMELIKENGLWKRTTGVSSDFRNYYKKKGINLTKDEITQEFIEEYLEKTKLNTAKKIKKENNITFNDLVKKAVEETNTFLENASDEEIEAFHNNLKTQNKQIKKELNEMDDYFKKRNKILNKANKYEKENNFEEAIICYKEIISSNKKFGLKYDNAGWSDLPRLYEKIDNKENQIKSLKEAIGFFKQYGVNTSNYEYELFVVENGIERVTPEYLIKLFKGPVLLNQGWKYYQRNKKDSDKLKELIPLLNKCEKSLMGNKDNAKLYRLYGDVYFANKSEYTALTYYQKSLEYNETKYVLRKCEQLQKNN